MAKLPVSNSTSRTVSIAAGSLREKSTEALIQAIRLPNDEGFTADRARKCLRLYFDPDMDNEDRAEMLGSFARALREYPKWVVAKGFDDWERTSAGRRPSPGEIVILASRVVKEITDELARRKREQAPDPEAAPPRVEGCAAERIMAAAGFTPKRIAAVRAAPMANSFGEAEARAAEPPVRHWTESATPAQLAQLQAARDANPLIIEARRSQVLAAERAQARRREAGQ